MFAEPVNQNSLDLVACQDTEINEKKTALMRWRQKEKGTNCG
jgi:hypothetical protein